MKETTGELSMTLIVIVAAIGLVALIRAFTNENGPIRQWIETQWRSISCPAATPNWDPVQQRCVR